MNVIGLREAKTKLTELGRRAQRGQRALITRRGRPFCVVIGVEGEDLVDVMIRWDPEFWRDLERRRARSASESIALEDLDLEKRKKSAGKRAPARRKRRAGVKARRKPSS